MSLSAWKNILPIPSLFLFPLLLCCFQCWISQEGGGRESSAASEDSSSRGWFTVIEVAEKVWCIDDHGGDNIYPVEGEEKALLIDTGTGVADLALVVSALTDLPLTVVNTHGHPDHAAGNFQFEAIYAHEQDFEMISQFNSRRHHRNTVEQSSENYPDFTSSFVRDFDEFDAESLIPVRAGETFDLGNRTIEVIEVPGHTNGSICLLDQQNRLLFTGDNNNIVTWLFLDGSPPLAVYLQTLQTLNQRSGEFDTMFPGHGEPLDTAFIDEQITCARNIINGTCDGESYETFAGEARICLFERAGIAYNPDNLVVTR